MGLAQALMGRFLNAMETCLGGPFGKVPYMIDLGEVWDVLGACDGRFWDFFE